MHSIVLTSLLVFIGISCVASQNYVAEVLFVVEPSVHKKYTDVGFTASDAVEEMKEDIKFYIGQINSYYQSLQEEGLNIEIRQSELLILDDVMFIDCKLTDKGTTLNADLGLKVFQEWLEDNKNRVTKPYDIAMVFTGFDIYGSSPSVTGYASVGAACNHDNHQNVGIVEFTGIEDTAMTTAHEIAHSLGSEHDAGKCSAREGYIMSPSLSYDNENKWSFSSCTKDGIAKYITSLETKGENCLTQTTAPAQPFELKSQKGRDILDENKICQRRMGSTEAYVCKGASLYTNLGGEEDGKCQSLFCAPKGALSCSSATSSEGMKCAANKRCSKSECLPAPSDFPTESTGSNGCEYPDDSSGNVFGYSSCQELVDSTGAHNCENDNVKNRCCETCKKYYTGIANCLYGDRSTQCANYYSNPEWVCYSPNNIRVCCKLCQSSKRRRRAAGPNGIKITEEKDKKIDEQQPKIKEEEDDKRPKVDQ